MAALPIRRPTIPISVAGDYPYRCDQGHWFRWDDKYLYLRGKVPVQVGDVLTFKGLQWTINMFQWLDTFETMLTVAPLPGVTLLGVL